MKRIALFLPLALVLSLCACGMSGTQPFTLAPFSAIASFSYNQTNYKARVSFDSVSDMDVSILEPASLEGLSFSQSGGETTIRFQGVRLQAEDLAVLPLPTPVPLLILRLLSAVGEGTHSVDRDGALSGALDDLTYELRVDPVTGFPLRFATDDFVCVFVNKT